MTNYDKANNKRTFPLALLRPAHPTYADCVCAPIAQILVS